MSTPQRNKKVEDIYPLSPMQYGMLFHALYEPDSPIYSERYQYAIEGELNIEALKKSWIHVAEATPVFRTIFKWEGVNEPLQVVVRGRIPELEIHNLTSYDSSSQENAIEDFLVKDKQTLFDLSKGPLMRFNLFQLSNRKYHFILSFHHILTDGWCVPLILKDCFLTYICVSQGAALPNIKRPPYRNYIGWLKKQDKTSANQYWKSLLHDFYSPTPMPSDFRPGKRAFTQVGKKDVQLTPELTAALADKARTTRVTLSALIQAAWGILLSRYGMQDDVVFGVTISGRPATLQGANDMIGLFINTLPMRVRFGHQGTINVLLTDLQSQSLKMQEYGHSFLPDVKACSGVSGSVGLFDSIVIVENFPTDLGEMTENSPIRVTDASMEEMTHFALTLVATPGDRLDLNIGFAPDLFRPQTIDRMMNHLVTLLEGIAYSKDTSVSEIHMLTSDERELVLRKFNDTSLASPRLQKDQSIVHLFESVVNKHPDQHAVGFYTNTLSYDELNKRANQLCRFLTKLGVEKGTRVGMMIGSPVETVTALLGIMKSGGVYLPIDPDFPEARIQYLLENSNAPVVITLTEIVDKLPDYSGKVVCMDDDWVKIADHDTANPGLDIQPDDIAYAIYTSGSTGKPKGTLIPHKGVVNLINGLYKEIYANYPDHLRVAQLAAFTFDASVQQIFAGLLLGHTLYPITAALKKDIEKLTAYIIDQKIDIIDGTPSLWELLVSHGITDNPGLNLKHLIVGGEALPVDLVRRYQAGKKGNASWTNVYGVTESSVDSTSCLVDLERFKDHAFAPIGKPIVNTRIYILDHELNPLPVGIPGEIHIAGKGLAVEYLNNPERTQESFIPDPFHSGSRMYKTGDLGKWLPDGNIEFLGRMDFQVKIRGFRIELGEVESVLAGHQDIAECVVTAQADISGDKQLTGYYVSPEEIPASDLRSFLGKTLPDYMIPVRFIRLDAMPLNTSGKVDRQALPAFDGTGAVSAEYAAPRNDLEKDIAAVWQDVLGVEKIGVNDNFFDLGGHSLAIMKILAKLKLKYPLGVQDFFDCQTISALSALITERQSIATDYQGGIIEEMEPEITVDIDISGKKEMPRHILLTGATGYLGAYMLYELLDNTNAHIYALVRGDDPDDRLYSNLAFYFDKNDIDRSRITAISGDLEHDDIFPEMKTRGLLAEKVDTIVHAAADVTHFGDYAHFKNINVLGTKRLVDFSLSGVCRHFHYISTISISGDYITNIQQAVFRETDYDRGQVLENVYAKSKFEAEGVVRQAMAKGLNAVIHRVGNLVGNTKTGKFQQSIETNAFYGLLQALIHMGIAADAPGTQVDLTPVDCCARAIVALMLMPESSNHTFHLFHPNQVGIKKIVDMVNQMGYAVSMLTPAEYIQIVTSANSSDALTSGMERLVHYLRGAETHRTRFIYDNRITNHFLKAARFEWPDVEVFFDKMIHYCNNIGFIKPPIDK